MQAEWWATQKPRVEGDKFGLKPYTECHAVDLYPKDSGLNSFYFKQEDYHNLSYKDEQFDIIWSHFSLEYSPTPLKALAEWRSVCKPDGHLYITLPASFKKKFGRIHTEIKPGQQSFFSLPVLMYLLAYSGWKLDGAFFQPDFKRGIIKGLIPANPDQKEALDPLTTNLYELAERGIFDRWVTAMINDRGTFDESIMVTTWITGEVVDFRSL